jgi:hypothetical protein
MATLVTIALGLALAYGVLFGAFLVICHAIRREDGSGTLNGGAPSWTAQSVRSMTGWHRSRWA